VTLTFVIIIYCLQPDPLHPISMVEAMKQLGIGSFTTWASIQLLIYTIWEWSEHHHGMKCDYSQRSIMAIARASCGTIVIACMHYMDTHHDEAIGADIRLRPMTIGALLTYGWLLGIAVSDDLPSNYTSTCTHLSVCAAHFLVVWWITQWPIVHWAAITTMMCLQNVILSLPFPRQSSMMKTTTINSTNHHHSPNGSSRGHHHHVPRRRFR
jgi:hypothetical protein